MRYEVFNAVTSVTVARTRWRLVAAVLAWGWAKWTGCWWYDYAPEGWGYVD